VGAPERSAVDLYFCTEDFNNNNNNSSSSSSSRTFKSTLLYRPYFFLMPDFSSLTDTTSSSSQIEVVLELLTSTLLRLFENRLYNVQVVYKMDLDQPNHLSPRQYAGSKNNATSISSSSSSPAAAAAAAAAAAVDAGGASSSSSPASSDGVGRPMLKLTFDSTHDLMDVRNQLRPMIEQNQKRNTARDGITSVASFSDSNHGNNNNSLSTAIQQDPMRLVVDMREYDVPYVVRVCTDLDIRAGTWYTVVLDGDDTDTTLEESTGGIRLTLPDRESKANPTFLAFDIECTKAPLKFPSADVDEIFMISYMVSCSSTGSGGAGGPGPQGYLICSRSVVSADVNDFEYTPKPNYPGPFHIFNEVDEKALLERFFDEYKKHRPQIVVTYNGDFFDWPFVEARAKHHGIDMFERTGVELVNGDGGYRGRTSVHLDAFHWVQRDSYLPQGAQGLKAVTKYKLGYDPVEVDPEDMVRFAQERPVHMATYSVSDAVATFYLYEKYVHLFIFSLCTIIPMGPEDVLCKGSGTLCEALLMVQACTKSIICPNKQVDPLAKFHKGHLLESETYIGGKVECLETGVYRSDVEYEFDLKPTAFQQLIDNIDRDLTFAIEVEGGLNRRDISNYDEVSIMK
jgi:DNA polymerase epsilon subunit 1